MTALPLNAHGRTQCRCLRSSDLIARRLGPAALSALNVVFGLLVLAIGTELIVHGIVNHGAVVQAGVR